MSLSIKVYCFHTDSHNKHTSLAKWIISRLAKLHITKIGIHFETEGGKLKEKREDAPDTAALQTHNDTECKQTEPSIVSIVMYLFFLSPFQRLSLICFISCNLYIIISLLLKDYKQYVIYDNISSVK